MHDIYDQFRDILRNEYVDIELTKKRLIALEETTLAAGAQFEHFRLACLNNLQHQHAVAIDYANRSLKIAETENDIFLLEHTHTLLGFIAYNRGNYEKCIEHYLSALQYVQSPRIINNIGAIFDDFNDMYEAYRYYRHAEEIFDDPLNFRLLAIIYSNIAECQTAFGHYDEAKRYLEMSQAQIRKFTHRDGTAYIYNALGDLAFIQGDYDTAIEHYTKGEDFAKDEAILVYYRNFILNHAKALYAKGSLTEAKARIALLFENSTYYAFDTNIPEVHELLAKIADAEGDLEMANKHYKKYVRLIQKRETESLQHRSESIKTAIKYAQLHTQLSTLDKMSKSDGLTGLANRFALREFMDTWPAVNLENQAVIALFDIDHFKLHNDYFGHAHGDRCLMEVANILKTHLTSEAGGIYRYGGDEFLVALIGSESFDAPRLLENARHAIASLDTAQIKPIGEKRTAITCSIGAVTVPIHSQQSFEDLFDIADRALYISKDQGRNCVTVLSSK
ncbi:GGDEF domain-containing protein [Fusibacter paucivorans]|uniref:GGDEF domain-containing protein n=1 Tax=Fusibacter paucivorans TaxID=76009 RepID=A0ABS5PL33_9FIRM|nr:tetratricopeptide repeat-containing diguanylate cyclase [Fusibacter paucivorans]MBS7525286.1 GGDEF domain-containing protein [Fusibacter paucivorans]